MIYATNNWHVAGDKLIIDEDEVNLEQFPYIQEKLQGLDPLTQTACVKIVGSDINGLAFVTEKKDGSIRINHFEIAENKRGQHYGKEFASELINECRDDYTSINLQTLNETSMMFWEHMGFQPIEDYGNGRKEEQIEFSTTFDDIQRKFGLKY